MADLPVRQFGGLFSSLQADIQRATHSLRKDVDSATNFTPDTTTDWADPPPTTVAEAINRLAAAVKAGSTSI